MSDGIKATRRKISDYVPDPHNANKGTERGQYMIDASVGEVGLARSIVAAADNTIPAGNKTLQAALDAGLEDVIEVETDGRSLVVVKRTDWPTVDDERARKYAYYDNRASEVDLAWDAEQLLADMESELDLSALFHEDELDNLIKGLSAAPIIPSPSEQVEPMLASECLIEIYCGHDDLRVFQETLNQWGLRNGVTVNIS